MCCNRCIMFVLCLFCVCIVLDGDALRLVTLACMVRIEPRWAAPQCTVPGSTSPTLSGISPAAIIAYFSGTCKPRRRFPPPFSATFRLSLPQPYRPFCRWPMPPISVGGFRQPSSQRRFCCWLPLLFPSADPSRLRRRPIGIFAGFLSAGLYQEPPPRFSPVPLGQRGCYGSCPAGGCPTFGAPVLSICYQWCRSIPKPHF